MTTLSDRYSRQMMLAEIGPEGQRRIMASSVLVIGLGASAARRRSISPVPGSGASASPTTTW